jgi:hypothetical protein
VAELGLAGSELADPAPDGLGLTAGALDELELDELGLGAGGLDGPRVALGGPDGLGSGAGLGWGAGLGRGAVLAHADERPPVTPTEAGFRPVRPVPARARPDGLALGPAGDGLAELVLSVADGLAELELLDALAELELPDALAELELPDGLAAGAATAGVDDAQPAAGCPLFAMP